MGSGFSLATPRGATTATWPMATGALRRAPWSWAMCAMGEVSTAPTRARRCAAMGSSRRQKSATTGTGSRTTDVRPNVLLWRTATRAAFPTGAWAACAARAMRAAPRARAPPRTRAPRAAAPTRSVRRAGASRRARRSGGTQTGSCASLASPVAGPASAAPRRTASPAPRRAPRPTGRAPSAWQAAPTAPLPSPRARTGRA
mmetsp:Transcript_16043/g.47158  ORF Transcript_16043/g.47158 Transcript_16043/m.47158 type:complete len:201 (+) Transcript_16043:1056-1658(+)